MPVPDFFFVLVLALFLGLFVFNEIPMRFLLISCLAMIVFCSGCNGPESKAPEIVADTVLVAAEKPDSAHVMVSRLPIQFNSTDVLLFLVQMEDFSSRSATKAYYEYGAAPDLGLSSGNFEGDKVEGWFVNVLFEDVNGVSRKLTQHRIIIESMHFLRAIFSATGKGYILYEVYDQDINGDGEFSYEDPKSLYLSNADGTAFRKLTKGGHKYHDHAVLKSKRSLYFRTLEDINKDGRFNANDRVHYYHVDFSHEGYVLKEYDPLKNYDTEAVR